MRFKSKLRRIGRFRRPKLKLGFWVAKQKYMNSDHICQSVLVTRKILAYSDDRGEVFKFKRSVYRDNMVRKFYNYVGSL